MIEQMQDDEKVVHSKALLLAETAPRAEETTPRAAALVVPEAVLPTEERTTRGTRSTISR